MKAPLPLTDRVTKKLIGHLAADGYVDMIQEPPPPKTMSAQETRRLVWAAQSVGVPDPPSFDRVLELRRERFGLKP